MIEKKVKTICIGAGGHAHAVLSIFKRNYSHGECVVFDADPKLHGKYISGFEVVGDDQLIASYQSKGYEYFIIALGMVKPSDLRKNLFNKMIDMGLKPLSVIDPTAIVMPDVQLGDGNTIMAGAIINSGANLGSNVIINTGAIIEHEVIIQDHVHIAPGAIICGRSDIGEQSFIGAASVIAQESVIDNNSLITPTEIVKHQKK